MAQIRLLGALPSSRADLSTDTEHHEVRVSSVPEECLISAMPSEGIIAIWLPYGCNEFESHFSESVTF